MPLHPPFFVKPLRKPVLVLALMITVILLGSYMAQYYVWNVNYSINPLTKTLVVVDLGAVSGATIVPPVTEGSYIDPVTTIEVLNGKTLEVYVLVPHDALDALEQHFHSLTVWVHIADKGAGGSPKEHIFKFILIEDGEHRPVFPEPHLGVEGIWDMEELLSGTWRVWFEVKNIWVGAVPENVEGAVLIYVYAIEV